jgi:hypothetical protein
LESCSGGRRGKEGRKGEVDRNRWKSKEGRLKGTGRSKGKRTNLSRVLPVTPEEIERPEE